MCALLEDALHAGAMGLSTNQLDYDKRDRPLPSQLADDDEYLALMRVVARYEGATVQIIIDNWMRMTAPAVVERLGRLSKQAGASMQWAGLPTLKFQEPNRKKLEPLHEQFKAEGLNFWTGFTHVEYMFSIDFKRTLLFAQFGLQTWQDLVEIKDNDEKLKRS
jgi:N-acyl-D-aspartate/D-glutamate deacylase